MHYQSTFELKLKSIKANHDTFKIIRICPKQNQIEIPNLTDIYSANSNISHIITFEEDKTLLIGKYFEQVHTNTSTLGCNAQTLSLNCQIDNLFQNNYSPLLNFEDLALHDLNTTKSIS